MNFKLKPSDLSFLYSGCKRCFYLSVRYNITQPSIPLPGIFTKIAGLLKSHFDQKRTAEIKTSLPPGRFTFGEKYVRSQVIELANQENTCFISGRFDIVAEFDDKTYGVIDFKTGSPKDENNNLYARQLQAYAYALENPAPGALGLSPVLKLGLLYFPVKRTRQEEIEKLLYEADIQWFEVKRDDKEFLKFLNEAVKILSSPTMPEPASDCQWCNYIKDVTTLEK